MNKNSAFFTRLKQETSDNKSSQVLLKANSSRSITVQKRLRRVKTLPGPGQYNLATFFNNKKGITIPHEQRQSQLKYLKPDPWSYIPNTSLVQPRSPNTTIGRERKFQRFINAPGPAEYRVNYNTILQRPRMPVIGSSRKTKIIQLKPGPSDYNTLQAEKVLKREIQVSIGRGSRDSRLHSNSPAPNQYKIQDEFSAQTKNKMGFTMGSRLTIKTESDAPIDFLKYNAQKQVVMSKAPAFSIKKEKKSIFNPSSSPGPAAYSPLKLQRHQSQGITIPCSGRNKNDHSQGVGIGKYNINVQNSNPSYSIPRANKTNPQFNSVPGPGLYTPQMPKTQKPKSIGMGFADKFNFIGQETPGPGKYNISVKQHRQGYSIGHSCRPGLLSEMRPGPADYHTGFQIASKYLSSEKKK